MSAVAVARIVPSNASMRGGENTGVIRARYLLCTGGSTSIGSIGRSRWNAGTLTDGDVLNRS